jgi:LacI family transcriptional regulator
MSPKRIQPRVTQRQVAAALGLEVTTVSKALRNHPGVALATRERVQKKAEEMGYRPDPMLGALARWREAQRAQARGLDKGVVLGWIHNHSRSAQMQRFAAYDEYLRGGRERAAGLGYGVEEFWIGKGDYSVGRLETVLRARGIHGLIIAPQEFPGSSLDLSWERFAAVAIGYTLKSPALNIVTNDHFQTMTRLVEELEARGCRRIGVYLWREDDRRVSGRTSSAFAAWREQKRIPLLAYDKPSQKDFSTWVRKHRFDAVITRETKVREWLRRARLMIPRPAIVASYALDTGEPGPGMDHRNAAIGAAAVDWVTRLLERGEYGLPSVPGRLLMLGQWREPSV